MSTESISDRREHVRSVGVTALAALAGVGAALASAAITSGVDPTTAAGDSRALAIVLAAILLQFPVLSSTGIYDDDELGPKHYLFVAFMTFSLWFVTWGILLSTGAGV
ncbi:hypothetical protein [Salinilacihabitans rarus]|uniref:EMC6-like membrane protein n=1 Tax=Salinilacihabitans rarus TaxID=2961596 RepID=UPI0020C88D52|nr:hypothetical protein [Salinilacihabitans rarus]